LQADDTAAAIASSDSVLRVDPSAGPEAEAITAVLGALREADFSLKTPALLQMFLETTHGKTLAAAEADMLSWGENFDVEAEFSGLISKFGEGQRRQKFQALQVKLAQNGISALTESERAEYRQLLQRN
jgi:hypothetical protein